MEDPMKRTAPRFVAHILALAVAIPACGDLSDVPAVVVNVDYRPDGQLVVFTSGGVKTYQGVFESEVGSFPIGSGDPYALQYNATHLSDDGRLAAVTDANQNNKTVIYSVPDGAILGSLLPMSPPLSAPFVALSPTASLAYSYTSAGQESPTPTAPQALYRISDGTQLWSVDYMKQTRPVRYCVSFSPDDAPPPVFTSDGTTMFLAFGEHLFVADAASGAMHEIATVHACIGGLTLLPDGSLLVLHGLSEPWGYPGLNGAPVTNPDLPDAALPNSFAIYSQDGTLLREIPPFAGNYYTPATIWGRDSPMFCSPLGDRCALFAQKVDPSLGENIMSSPSFILVWSLDGSLLYTIPAPATGTAAFSPDGSKLAVAFPYSAEVTSSARIYRAEDGTLLAERSYTRGVF
jgi:hypothetical protein